jgi:hypothetical protein
MVRSPSDLLRGVVILLAAAPAAGQVTAVDRYLCYGVTPSAGSPEFPSGQKALRDAFPPITTYTLEKVVALCNPANVDGAGTVHPNDHEVAYRIRATRGSPRFARRTVSAIDQYGAHTLQVQRPDGLLVPSSKVLGSGGSPPYGVPGIRHYECYRARQSDVVAPASAGVVDQFRSARYELRRPSKLCTPVDKNGEDPQAPNDPTHLVCYKVRGPKLARTAVSTNNQIRPETLDAVRALELCVPALIAGASTTTSSTASSSTNVVITTSTSGPPTTATLPLPCGDPMSPPQPLCWGACPAVTPICASTVNGCQCVPGDTPCGSATFPECDGACGAGEACAVSPTLGCTCQSQGIPCSAAYALTGTCGGVCPQDYTCVGPFFTSDGDGCACVPTGSTCHITCGADPGAGNCPPGQTCGSFLPGGPCFCQ